MLNTIVYSRYISIPGCYICRQRIGGKNFDWKGVPVGQGHSVVGPHRGEGDPQGGGCDHGCGEAPVPDAEVWHCPTQYRSLGETCWHAGCGALLERI